MWYSTYRFYLSIIVGFSIIGTLAGTSFYGVGSGAVAPAGEIDVTTAKLSSMKRLDKVAAKNHRSVSGKLTGVVGGDVETEDLGPEGDAFVKLVHKTKVRLPHLYLTCCVLTFHQHRRRRKKRRRSRRTKNLLASKIQRRSIKLRLVRRVSRPRSREGQM